MRTIYFTVDYGGFGEENHSIEVDDNADEMDIEEEIDDVFRELVICNSSWRYNEGV